MRALSKELEIRWGKSLPEIQGLLDTPGAAEARQMLTNRLIEKATARFVRLVFGPSPKRSPPVQQGRQSIQLPQPSTTRL